MRHRLAAVLALFALLSPALALAHVLPRSVAPSAAGGLDLSLTAPAEERFLTAEDGRAERDPVDPYLLHLQPDAETMDVTVLSRDGHVTTLAVDATYMGVVAEDRVDPPFVLLGRLLSFAALIAVAGGAIIAGLVLGPALRAPIRRLGGAAEPDTRTIAAVGPMPGRVGRVLGWVGVVGATLGVLGLAGRLGTTRVLELLTRTRPGHVLLAAGIASLVAAAALGPRARLTGVRTAVAGAAASLGLVAVSLGGHATTGTDAVLSGVFDVAHLLATAVWLGGLLMLLCIRRAIRTAWNGNGVGSLAAVVVRFSAVAITCVAVLAVTGTYRALAELSSLGDLTGTAYGRALLVKLAIFALMLGVGAYNRLVVHPRLERAALGLASDDHGATSALGVSLRAEVVLATGLIAVVALMIGFPPPG